jgi:hypothetical protein
VQAFEVKNEKVSKAGHSKAGHLTKSAYQQDSEGKIGA